MENKNKISVIVTSHNYGEYIEQCIDSLCEQKMIPDEIIIVDDASDDDTRIIVQKKMNNFSEGFIKYFKVDFRHAQASRKFGLQRVFGEYILFFDADNFVDYHFLHSMYNAMIQNNSDLVYCDHALINESGDSCGSWQAGRYSYSRLKRLNFIDMSSLCKKEFLDDDFFDEKINRFQDWDVWLSYLSEKSSVTYLRNALIKKRLHDQSITSTQEKYFEKLKVLWKHDIISFTNLDNISGKVYFKCLCSKCIRNYSIDDYFSILRKRVFTMRKYDYFIFSFVDHVDSYEQIIDKNKCYKKIILLNNWKNLFYVSFSQKNLVVFLNATIDLKTLLQKTFSK